MTDLLNCTACGWRGDDSELSAEGTCPACGDHCVGVYHVYVPGGEASHELQVALMSRVELGLA